MNIVERFKSFFAKKKETYEIPFDRVIEMMKSEEMFAKAVKSQGEEVVYENSTYFNYLLDLVYKSGIENIVKLMNSDVKCLNRGEVEKQVLDKKLAKWSYEWVKAGFGELNFEKHQQIVLNEKDPMVCYNFARDIQGADIEAHSKVVLERGSGLLSRLFAQTVNKFSIDHLKKYVDYLVGYITTQGSYSSDSEIRTMVQDLFKNDKIHEEYSNLLAENTKENKKLKEYIIKYTEAMIRRRDLDSIVADDIVIAK